MNFRTYKLKDIGEVITGNTPSKSNSEFYDSKDVMFIKPDDLYIDRITMLNESKEYLSNKGAEHARILPQGSVLVTCIGIIGKVGILKQEIAAFNQQINAIVPNKNIVNEKYLAYKIWDYRKKLQRIANAPVVPIINKRQFSDFQIEIPPIDYQLKVVDVLDKAQELIDKRKAQIEALDQLTKSVFLEMFGDPVANKTWERRPLKDIADVRDGTHDSPKYVPNGYPLVTSKNIKNGKIDLSNVNYISEEDFININKRSKVDVGDIIMPMIGTIGNPIIVDEQPNFAIKNVALIKFNNPLVVNIYLKYLLDSHYLDYILNKNKRGGTQKFLSLTDIRNMEIPLPPRDLQDKFSEIVKKIDSQKSILHKSLRELEKNFNSLMQRAFKGELFND
ncbi:restriction endonuclease subunit S [Anoxybacillus sp. FSL W8-0382]|uniref:restriction endonuclease subunit S n=1 Tax=Anoxybacillus TaxID=150247 RepID=UPI0018677EFB|nr:restriction endonuclease subunit S [Anoxybacillus flavithermus]MBE2913588.1 restriction endonuclease subunit S [Anoxybacillus flavithermus]MBE2940726.1 restriction endonuclease subunit S [Anoxybacillus flavithermus]MBE2943418.1 restriction endonuclease subunit S [Anoxybacillus flavithermus]MBE2951736.1 restriction endonuclease subunit S [Anoxybacillus flavithermus]MBE2954357.1 restriction endonuclease subunit S [Anoxybacillus flavithermus]